MVTREIQFDRMMRLPDVEYVTGLRRRTLKRMAQRGEFPAPKQLGPQDMRNLYHPGLEVRPFDVLTAVDCGDARSYPGDLSMSHDALRCKVDSVLEVGAIPIALGGDHSITLPVATAVADRHGYGSFGLLYFDAHADTADQSYGSVRNTHSSPMRRLIESGAVPGQNFVQVGLRGYWPHPELFDWMAGQGMRWHSADAVRVERIGRVISQVKTDLRVGERPVYLSVDVDVVDPAFAPGTGTPEPGGLTSWELLWSVRQVASTFNLVALDVVEVCPAYDPGGLAAELAHRVVLEAVSGTARYRLNHMVEMAS